MSLDQTILLFTVGYLLGYISYRAIWFLSGMFRHRAVYTPRKKSRNNRKW